MSARFRAHRFAAILVFVCATAWVVTGKFASVGSEEAHAAQQSAPATADTATADTATELRTVAVIAPGFTERARAISLSGSTAPDKQTVLAARSSGIISKLPATKGHAVARDALVMMIEGPDLAANIATAKAVVTQRNNELLVAEKLFASGNQSETRLIAARSAKAAAASQLSQAQVAADKLELRAPFAGLVDDVAVELGQWIQIGTPVATLLSLDPIVVKAEVSETDVALIHPGARAKVRLVDGREMEGKVRFVAAQATPATRTYPVEVALPNPGRAIPAGMTAEVILYAPPVKSVTVPRSVITLSKDGTTGLRVVDAQDVAHFAPIQLIDDTPGGLILAGVPDGMRIIVSGQDLVKDGQKVHPVTPPAGHPLQ